MIYSILVLGLLIVVHEYGHFIVAKLCGIGVIKFSVGFGPSIIKKRYKDTIYQLSIIPLGGYVRMLGDMPDMLTGPQATDEAVRSSDKQERGAKQDGDVDADNSAAGFVDKDLQQFDQAFLEDRSRWFLEKPLWARSAVVAAGPIFNFALGAILVFLSIVIYGESEIQDAPQIGSVFDDGPAYEAGLREGDRVLKLNGVSMLTWEQLARSIHDSVSPNIELQVLRGAETLNFQLKSYAEKVPTADGEFLKKRFVGIGPVLLHKKVNALQAVETAFLWTMRMSVQTCAGLWGFVTGKVDAGELAGPIFIFSEAKRQAEKGFEELLFFAAFLSVSLAVLNLLPIPILDGGHLLFFGIEAIFGPLSVRAKELAQQVGLVLLLGLMGVSIHNDIFRSSKREKAREAEQVQVSESENARESAVTP